MTMLFDENKTRNLSERLEMRLIRNEKQLLNSWEISNFINQISSNYYKVDLIKTIAEAIGAGVKPQNIFILSKSFKLNHSYSQLDIININSKELNLIYGIGEPVSMMPNDKIHFMSLIFKYFRQANESLYKTNGIRLDKSILLEHLNTEDKSLETAINSLELQFVKSRKLQKNLKSFDNIKNKILIQHNDYSKDNKKRNNFEEQITKTDDLKELLEEQESVERKYYSKFFDLFSMILRPVVGIYYEEEAKFQILCNSHINKSKRSATYLDVKKIHHYNPIDSTFVGLAEIVIPLISGFTLYGINKQIKEKELELKGKEIELKDQEINTQKELQLTEKFKQRALWENRLKEVPKKIGEKVDNPYIENKLVQAYGKVQGANNAMLLRNKFKIHNDVDFKA